MKKNAKHKKAESAKLTLYSAALKTPAKNAIDKLTSNAMNRPENIYLAAAAAIVIIHFLILASFFKPAASGLDSHGYIKQSRLIADTGRNFEVVESRAQFTGYTWRQSIEKGRYDNPWPAGFPAILAAIRIVFGAKSVYWANPIMASLALIVFFLFCRERIGSRWSLAALTLFAINPVFNQHIHYNYSHIAVLFFLMMSLALAVRSLRSERSALLLLAAGLSAGCIPSIRMIESIFVPAILFYIVIMSDSRKSRRAAAFASGAALPIIAFCVWNQIVYGAFWKTGYSLFYDDISSMFSFKYLALYSLGYIQKLLGEGLGFAFAPGILGIVFLCARRATWKEGFLFASIVLPLMLLQISYLFHPAPEMMRFFIPVFPLLSLASVWLLKELTSGKRKQGIALAAALIVLSAIWGIPQTKYSLNTLKFRQNALAGIAEMLEKNAPRGSVVIADEVVAQHLDALGYWKVADANLLVEDRQRLYGRTTPQNKVAAFEKDALDWAGDGGRVFWVGKDSAERAFAPYLASTRMSPKAEIILEDNPYLRESDFAIRARNRTSPNSPPLLKRGCGNFDMGALGRFELMFAALLDGSPFVLYELKPVAE
ncbi:MAG: hypothetical protein BWY28_00504 [bacterium ADurb.Bin236]|nr:MAG: hypothetical protein BWY28_00504 [bacterium ADurb.Bin236]